MKKLMMGLVLALGVLAVGGKAEAYTYTVPAMDYKNYKAPAKDYEAWDITLDVTYDYTTAYQILWAVNDYREANGLCRLQTNDTLMKRAMRRAVDLNIDFKHGVIGPGYILVDSNNYRNSASSENIYMNTGGITCADAMLGWKNSVGHNQNMLDSRWVGAGVGVVGNQCVLELFGGTKFNCFDLKFGTDTGLVSYSERITVPVFEILYKPVLGDINYETYTEKSSDGNYPHYLDNGGVYDLDTSFPITSVTIHKAEDEDNLGSTFKAPAYNFTFTSSNPSVAKVEGNQVTFVGYGKADITATLNGTNYSKTYSFEYKAPQEEKKATTKLSKTSVVSVKRAKASKHRTKLSVSWRKVKNASSYTVQVSTNKKFRKCVTTKTAKKCKVVLTKKFKGKKVYVRVRAVNGKKTGPWSKVKKIKTYK